MTTLPVQIGDLTHRYRLFETTAPVVYDAGSTLTLATSGKTRHVLIDETQVEWHLGRYASGLYACEEIDLDCSLLSYAVGVLWHSLKDASDREAALHEASLKAK